MTGATCGSTGDRSLLAWRRPLLRYQRIILNIAWKCCSRFATLLLYTFVFAIIAQLPSSGVPRCGTRGKTD
jgi:ABC-type polysaccharide/polyol phosphate export permease